MYYILENGKARALKVLINNKPIFPAILVGLLKFAVFRNNVNAVKVLLKAGFDITIQITGNLKGWDGATALYIAASLNKRFILKT